MQQENENNIEPVVTDQTNTFSLKTLLYVMVYGCITFAIWGKFRGIDHSELVAVLVLQNFGALLGMIFGRLSKGWLGYFFSSSAILTLIGLIAFGQYLELFSIFAFLSLLPFLVFYYASCKWLGEESNFKKLVSMTTAANLPCIYVAIQILFKNTYFISLDPNESITPIYFTTIGGGLFGMIYGYYVKSAISLLNAKYKIDKNSSFSIKFRYLNRVAFTVGIIWLLFILLIFSVSP